MTTQIQEKIDLRPKIAQRIPSTTFYAIIDKIKKHKTPSRVLANDFLYSMSTINAVRCKAISLGLLERPKGVIKMMETIEQKKALGIPRFKESSQATKEVSKNIKITTPVEKDSLSASKFVNIKFGEIEVVVEKSANIIITKDKIVIN